MHAPPCGALHHNVVAPQSPGFGPPPQGAGPNPGDACGVETCTPTGCDKTDVAPSERVTPRTAPIPTRGRIGPCFVGDRILFNPVGVSIAESSPPQGTAPRPTGPGSRTLGFGVPPRCGEDTQTNGFGLSPQRSEDTHPRNPRRGHS